MSQPSPIARLRASKPQPLPFAPALDIRAFLLQRERGDLLLYSVTELDFDGGLGAVSRHYLNHRHEAGFLPDAPPAPLFCHAVERASVSGEVAGTFSERQLLDDDFELIPTPGHTPGATAFLWDSGQHRILFTSDTIYLDDGEWVAAVLRSSDREAYVGSLELIASLDFDVLVPWAATRGRPWHTMTDRADAQRRVGALLERLRGGGDR